MTIQNIFSVPLYISNVTMEEKINIESAILNYDFDFIKGIEQGADSESLGTDQSKNFFSLGTFDFFESVVRNHLHNYLKDVDSEIFDFDIDVAWVNKTKKGLNIPTHNHRDADISCVYYVKTNSTDGDLVLYSPNPAIDASRWIGAGSQIRITPKEGQILFFPSWLLHSTTLNSTSEDRISIAIDFVETKQ